MSSRKTKQTPSSDPLLDIRNMMYVIWKHLGLPDPTKRQYEIAEYLTTCPDRAMVQAFRGVGKSWIAAVLCIWTLYKDPQKHVVIVSASKSRSDQFTQFILKLLKEIPALQHLAPREGQRESMVCFDVGPARAAQSPSVQAVGITGMMTGSRADLIIADDVEAANNAETVGQREKLAERIKEFAALLKPGGRILYLGTPQSESSIYNLLPDRAYDIRIWPALYPDDKQLAAYNGRLAPEIYLEMKRDPSLVGHSTEPTRFTDKDLEARKLEYGPAGFALQFMLDPRLADEDQYPLKLRDCMVWSLTPEAGPERMFWAGSPDFVIDLPNVGLQGDRWHRPVIDKDVKYAPWTGVVMFIDPAGRGKDETAYCILAALHGLLFLLDAGGFKGYDTPVLEELAQLAKHWGVKAIEVEPNFGDGMFLQLLKPVLARIYPCSLKDSERPKGQKEARIIDTLRPVLQGHKLVVNQELIEKDYRSTLSRGADEAPFYRLFYQLSHITRERGCLKHDDRVDALAGAVNYFKAVIARDNLNAAREADQRRIDQELRDFAASVFKTDPKHAKKPTWHRRV